MKTYNVRFAVTLQIVEDDEEAPTSEQVVDAISAALDVLPHVEDYTVIPEDEGENRLVKA